MFSQKLDFIMNLTNSHNIELARAMEMDASAVSRLRAGIRRPPKSLAFLPSMSSYFAQRLTSEHQKRTAADTICPGIEWPEHQERAAEYIQLWFAQSCTPQPSIVEELINSIADLRFPASPAAELAYINSALPQQSLYYGTEGLRKAFIDFLEAAIASRKPHTLYLFTDECSSWMDSDPDYLFTWSSRLKQLISFGCNIKIIYNTSCSETELIRRITKWLPLYITHSVEPYYFPKIRDCVYRRTLFVAEGIAALQASTLNGFQNGELSHLITDTAGVAALEGEITSYLSHCKPLLDLLMGSANFANALLEHDRGPGSYIIAGMTPSLFTMPLIVAERVSYRSSSDDLFIVCRKLKETDLTRNGSRTLCELINIPSDEELAANDIPVGVGALLGLHDCYYTGNEFSVHLKSISEFSRLHRGYCFELTDKLPHNIIIYCKENEWALISKCNMPCYGFVFRQPAIVNAITRYLRNIYSDIQNSSELRAGYARLMKKIN